tara:strand:+ start:48871 stop:49959 length:1089 start_codon:yes stop_codon:yes gene_type:complete
VASWSKLKQHIKILQQHRQAIIEHHAPLDSDPCTLHVRCGHDIQGLLKEAGFKGDFLALIDPLCIGPLPASKKDFIVRRAKYVHQYILPIIGRSGEEEMSNIIDSETQNRVTLLSDKYQRIVFWVEHDSYDQFMLVYALTQLVHISDKEIEIIEINQFPGTERFIGLGQLPAEAIRSCWQSRKAVTAKMMLSAHKSWQALTYSKPSLLVELLQKNEIDCLLNMSNALTRHLQELPNRTTGLSLTQTIALQVLFDRCEPITINAWFADYQKNEPLPFLGDVMFYALLLPLTKNTKPLFNIENKASAWEQQLVSITAQGIACINGETTFIQDYWVGGIHCRKTAQWQWDHQKTNTLFLQRFNGD